MTKIVRIPLAVLCLLITGFTLRAQVLDDNLCVTNGPVRAIARSHNTIYVGGDFSSIGPKTGNGIVVNRQDGKQTGNLKSLVNNEVHAAVPDGSGGWYIGGQFTQAGGAEHQALAHIMADGSVDPAFNFNFTLDPLESGGIRVATLSIANNRLYVGGAFSIVNGIRRRCLAAIDLTTNQLLDWKPEKLF